MLVNQSLLSPGLGPAGPREWTAITAHGPESKHDGLQLPRAPIWTGLSGSRLAAHASLLMQIMQTGGGRPEWAPGGGESRTSCLREGSGRHCPGTHGGGWAGGGCYPPFSCGHGDCWGSSTSAWRAWAPERAGSFSRGLGAPTQLSSSSETRTGTRHSVGQGPSVHDSLVPVHLLPARSPLCPRCPSSCPPESRGEDARVSSDHRPSPPPLSGHLPAVTNQTPSVQSAVPASSGPHNVTLCLGTKLSASRPACCVKEPLSSAQAGLREEGSTAPHDPVLASGAARAMPLLHPDAGALCAPAYLPKVLSALTSISRGLVRIRGPAPQPQWKDVTTETPAGIVGGCAALSRGRPQSAMASVSPSWLGQLRGTFWFQGGRTPLPSTCLWGQEHLPLTRVCASSASLAGASGPHVNPGVMTRPLRQPGNP